MTVAAIGGAGRAAAAAGGGRAVAGAGNRAASGRTIDGSVVNKRPANAPKKSGKSGGSSAAGTAGTAAGSAGQGLISGSAMSRALDKGARTALPGSPARRMLVAEFAACMVVLAFSPVASRGNEPPQAFMKRSSAVMALFFVLGLIASGGRAASRAAAGFGGLVTLGLLISNRSVFLTLAKKIGTDAGERMPDDDSDDVEGIFDPGEAEETFNPPDRPSGADPGKVKGE